MRKSNKRTKVLRAELCCDSFVAFRGDLRMMDAARQEIRARIEVGDRAPWHHGIKRPQLVFQR